MQNPLRAHSCEFLRYCQIKNKDIFKNYFLIFLRNFALYQDIMTGIKREFDAFKKDSSDVESKKLDNKTLNSKSKVSTEPVKLNKEKVDLVAFNDNSDDEAEKLKKK